MYRELKEGAGVPAEEQITTIGRCYACKRTFTFVPAHVTKVTVDPETGLPPDMTVLGTAREPSPEALARAVQQPICADCVKKAEQHLAPPPPFDTWQA